MKVLQDLQVLTSAKEFVERLKIYGYNIVREKHESIVIDFKKALKSNGMASRNHYNLVIYQ